MLAQPSRVLISRFHGSRIHQPFESTLKHAFTSMTNSQQLELDRERSRHSRHAAGRQALAKIHAQAAHFAVDDRVGRVSGDPNSWTDNQVRSVMGGYLSQDLSRAAARVFLLAQLHDSGDVLV